MLFLRQEMFHCARMLVFMSIHIFVAVNSYELSLDANATTLYLQSVADTNEQREISASQAELSQPLKLSTKIFMTHPKLRNLLREKRIFFPGALFNAEISFKQRYKNRG